MNCEKIKAKLLEYFANELPDELNQAFDVHIKSCPACQKELGELRKTIYLFDQLPQVVIPPEREPQFLSEVRRKIRLQTEPEPVRLRWSRLLPRLIPALAVASILIFFVTMRLKSSENKYAEMASNFFASPSLSLSGEFVSDYFKTNGNGTVLKEELSQFNSSLIEEIESYLSNQLEISDLVEGMTEPEKLQLEQKIKGIL